MPGRFVDNKPYPGKVTIQYVPGGGFEAWERVIPKAVLLTMIKDYLDRLTPTAIAARRPDPPAQERQPVSPLGAARTVRLRKAATG